MNAGVCVSSSQQQQLVAAAATQQQQRATTPISLWCVQVYSLRVTNVQGQLSTIFYTPSLSSARRLPHHHTPRDPWKVNACVNPSGARLAHSLVRQIIRVLSSLPLGCTQGGFDVVDPKTFTTTRLGLAHMQYYAYLCVDISRHGRRISFQIPSLSYAKTYSFGTYLVLH